MAGFTDWALRWQWRRGLRALAAIGAVMAVCYGRGLAPQAASLGAFTALLVDNGGPYRPRLTTMAMGVVGGALALVAGALVPAAVGWAVLVTLLVCWLVTYARVLSQPMASTSVLILVSYFAGLGGSPRPLAWGLAAAEMMVLGGAWAMLLSLVLWPLDAFRPARMAVAECYLSLANLRRSSRRGRPGKRRSMTGSGSSASGSKRRVRRFQQLRRGRLRGRCARVT